MSDAKRAPLPQGTSIPSAVSSFVREHDVNEPPPAKSALAANAPMLGPEAFLEDWALRHFTVSVKLHDAERLCEGDVERTAVLNELAEVQGVLIELHEFAMGQAEVQALLAAEDALQNGVNALYAWLDEVLDAAVLRPVARRRPGFVDGGDDGLVAIATALERLHPDLEALVRGSDGALDGVGHKLSICFRQIGAAVVRVTGRAASLPAPPM